MATPHFRRYVPVAALLVLFGFFLNSVHADVVRYTDAQGKIHYVDSINKVPAEFRGQLNDAKPLPPINRERGFRFSPVADRAPVPEERATQARVELFVTSWCPYCQQLEAALRANKVTYTRYDIEKSAEGKRKYDAIGGRGIPITKVGDSVIRGNNLQGVLSALGR